MAWKTMQEIRWQQATLNYEHRALYNGEFDFPRCPKCGSDDLTGRDEDDKTLTAVRRPPPGDLDCGIV